MKLETSFLAFFVALTFACHSSDGDAPAPAPTPEPPPVLVDASFGEVGNVHAFGDIWTGGQPTPADLERLPEIGVRTVINLRRDEEMTELDEGAILASVGIDYVSIPWAGPAQLTDEIFDRCRDALESAERPLFFHCKSANRVGAVWIPWRVLDQGATFEEALDEAKRIGMRTPGYETRAREYVDARR